MKIRRERKYSPEEPTLLDALDVTPEEIYDAMIEIFPAVLTARYGAEIFECIDEKDWDMEVKMLVVKMFIEGMYESHGQLQCLRGEMTTDETAHYERKATEYPALCCKFHKDTGIAELVAKGSYDVLMHTIQTHPGDYDGAVRLMVLARALKTINKLGKDPLGALLESLGGTLGKTPTPPTDPMIQ